ncbi:MAG: DUF697 domain-containing protein [Ignavibacteria bacterium]|nr:DUF697 domain-containing protein [Ignavibacteria bacterium]
MYIECPTCRKTISDDLSKCLHCNNIVFLCSIHNKIKYNDINYLHKCIDIHVSDVIDLYSKKSFATMVAIPIPGLDIGATVSLWTYMVVDIAKAYSYEVDLKDAYNLASKFIISIVNTTCKWYGSAKTANTILKFIPVGGTITAVVSLDVV